MSNPKIRFKAVSGTLFPDWKESSFEEVLRFLRAKPISRANLNFDCGENKNIHYGDILVKYPDVLDVGNSVVPFVNNNVDIGNATLLQDHDVVFADTAEDNTAGRAIELKNIGSSKIYSGLHTIPCRPVVMFASGYLGFYLNSKAYHSQLLTLLTGTKVFSISKSQIKKTKIKFPCFEEQEKIGLLFSGVNKKIAIAERKLNAIKDLNRSLIHSLITCKECPWKKDGWKTVELGHIVNFQKERSSSNFYVGTEDLKANFSGVNKTEREYQEGVSFSEGNLLLGNIRPYLRKLWLADSDGVCSPDVLVLCANGCDPFYLKTVLSSDHFFAHIANGYKGSKMPRGDKKQILKYELKLPSTIEEQKEISIIFKYLEQKIICCKKQIDTLKMLKQSLLQQMFI